ncbi:MAG: DUF433 domain-containing protein [Candidatus Nanopelagicales bacterium]|nr:DUF433 domain-containing protein [Candidatus Nanopelagicales bacterium]
MKYARITVGEVLMKITLADRIVSDSEIMEGKPTIDGTRVTVSKIVRLVAAGTTTEQICDDYPYVQPEDVAAALTFSAHELERTSYHALLA